MFLEASLQQPAFVRRLKTAMSLFNPDMELDVMLACRVLQGDACSIWKTTPCKALLGEF